MNLLEATRDAALFAPWFRDRSNWAAWFAFIAALFGLPMPHGGAEIYRECTGRREPPTRPFSEAWLVCGRRAGKSFVLALCAVYLACFRDYQQYLAPGERATILIIATDRKQARVILRYIAALLREIPLLNAMIERQTAESFDLNNGITIEVATASHKVTRGYTIAACLGDEIAFWAGEESVSPDFEILDAVRPGMATIPNSMLLCASSPYAQRGALFDAFKAHYGRDDSDVLIWRAPTRRMNPTVDQAIIDRAYERDAAVASAEYGAEFRRDIEILLDPDAVAACVDREVRERPRVLTQQYLAFCDPSGGSKDSFTLAVGHIEKGDVMVDAIRERKAPFSPADVVEEYATVLKSYGLRRVTGDRYAGQWPREAFQKKGVEYVVAPRAKNEIYGGIVATINSGRIRLLDHPVSVAQFCALERRTGRGRDIIDHPVGGHDDCANSIAGVSDLLLSRSARTDPKTLVAGPIIIEREDFDFRHFN